MWKTGSSELALLTLWIEIVTLHMLHECEHAKDQFLLIETHIHIYLDKPVL